MPENQSEATAANSMNVATVSQVAKPVDITPKAPVENKVYSPETDNQFSAAEIEALINKAKEPKVETPKVEEKLVSDGIQKSILTETSKGEIENGEVKKEGVQEVALKLPDVSFETKVAEQVEKILKSKEPKKEAVPEFTGFATQEELNASFEKDPTGTFDKVVDLKVRQKMELMKAELQEGIEKSLAPVKAEAQIKQRDNHLESARKEVGEFNDPNFTKLVSDKIGDPKNSVLFNDFLKNGKNPYVEMAKIVRGENISAYIDQAKQQGFKEGEEKERKAARASVEGGGKGAIEENMTVEKFDKMTSAEQEKYLISKGAITR